MQKYLDTPISRNTGPKPSTTSINVILIPILTTINLTQTLTDHKGKQRKRYPYDLMMIPYEKLKSPPNSKNHLPKIIKLGVTFEMLGALACQQSDNDATEQLQKAKQHLFNLIYEQQGQLA